MAAATTFSSAKALATAAAISFCAASCKKRKSQPYPRVYHRPNLCPIVTFMSTNTAAMYATPRWRWLKNEGRKMSGTCYTGSTQLKTHHHKSNGSSLEPCPCCPDLMGFQIYPNGNNCSDTVCQHLGTDLRGRSRGSRRRPLASHGLGHRCCDLLFGCLLQEQKKTGSALPLRLLSPQPVPSRDLYE